MWDVTVAVTFLPKVTWDHLLTFTSRVNFRHWASLSFFVLFTEINSCVPSSLSMVDFNMEVTLKKYIHIIDAESCNGGNEQQRSELFLVKSFD